MRPWICCVLLVFAATGALAQGLTEEYGFDHPGGDYNSFRVDSLDVCKRACQREARCQAYTYLSRQDECYLKETVNPSQRNRDAITGVKGSRDEGRLSEEWGYDRSG